LWPAPPEWRLPRFQTSILPYIGQGEDTLHPAIREQQTVALLLARYGFFGNKYELLRAYCLMPENGNVRYFMSLEFSGRLPNYETFCGKQG
jgi:hypothetical protein